MAEITSKVTALSESIAKILKDDSADLVSNEIAIAWLDSSAACVISKTKIKIGEDWQAVGSEIRQDFQNTTEGRAKLEKAVTEPYLSAILDVWAAESADQNSDVQNISANS